MDALGVAPGQDVFLTDPEILNRVLQKTVIADEVADGGYCGDINSIAFSKHADTLIVHEITVFEGIDTGTDGGFDSSLAIGVGHDGHSFFVSDMDHFCDFCIGQGVLGQAAIGGKIHDTADHDLDKISMLLLCFFYQRMIFCHIFKGQTDDTAVMAFFMNAETGCTVDDAVFRSEFSG